MDLLVLSPTIGLAKQYKLGSRECLSVLLPPSATELDLGPAGPSFCVSSELATGEREWASPLSSSLYLALVVY